MASRKHKPHHKKFVIQSAGGGQLERWRFRHFADAQGNSLVRPEITARGTAFAAALDTFLRYIEFIVPLRSPHTKRLNEGPWKGKGLMELRLLVGNVQCRPIAFYGPERRDVTILTIAEERGDKLVPDEHQVISTACERKRIIHEDPRRVVNHRFGKVG